LWWILCAHGNSENVAFPGVPTLMVESGLLRRSVQYALGELEADGWIGVLEDKRGGGGIRAPDIIYTLPESLARVAKHHGETVPGVQSSAPLKNRQGRN
jgi:hypothetical protein